MNSKIGEEGTTVRHPHTGEMVVDTTSLRKMRANNLVQTIWHIHGTVLRIESAVDLWVEDGDDQGREIFLRVAGEQVDQLLMRAKLCRDQLRELKQREEDDPEGDPI